MTGRSLPLGVTFASLQGAVAPASAGDVARRAADLGYRSFWTAEVVGPEAFALLASVATQVPDLDLGTGVVALQLRTPPLLAMAAATVQALVPERDILVGVGISSPVVAGRWHGAGYGDRPLAQVREFVTLLRACLSGEQVDFEGDFHKVSRFRLGMHCFAVANRTPILGGEMIETDGEGGDKNADDLVRLRLRNNAQPRRRSQDLAASIVMGKGSGQT